MSTPTLFMPDDLPANARAAYQKIADQYAVGQQQVQRQLFEEGIKTFQGCLKLAIEIGLPLFIEQYIDIMLSVAFAYADLQRYENALKVYLHLARTIRQEGEWYKQLPANLKIAFTESFDRDIALATVYTSVALAYDNNNDHQNAIPYYQQSAHLYQQAGLLDQAARVWYFKGTVAKRREDWETLRDVGEAMLPLYIQSENFAGQVQAYQYLVRAYINQKDIVNAVEFLEKAVVIERQINHPMLATDTELLNMIKGATQAPASSQDAIPRDLLRQKLEVALNALNNFALAHGGPSEEDVEVKKKGLLGGRTQTQKVPRWSIGFEMMPQWDADGFMGNVPSAVLDLLQEPEAIVVVQLKSADEFLIGLMSKKQLPNVPEPAFVGERPSPIPATAEALLAQLQRFLKEGHLAVQQGRLRFQGNSTAKLALFYGMWE